MRTLYSKFTTKSFRLLSAAFFLIGDISFAGYLYYSMKTDLKVLLNNPMFKELFQKTVEDQGLKLPPRFNEGLLEIFLQSIILLFILGIIAHVIIYLFYVNEKRMTYLYLRFVSAMGILSALFMIINKISASPVISCGFLLVGLLYFFNFTGFFYFPILPKRKKVN